MKYLFITLATVLITSAAQAGPAIDVNSPTVNITAATSTDSVAYPGTNERNITVTNDSDKTCFIKSGTSGVTAVATDMPILPGLMVTFSKTAASTHIAAICEASVSGTVYISEGPGE